MIDGDNHYNDKNMPLQMRTTKKDGTVDEDDEKMMMSGSFFNKGTNQSPRDLPNATDFNNRFVTIYSLSLNKIYFRTLSALGGDNIQGWFQVCAQPMRDVVTK